MQVAWKQRDVTTRFLDPVSWPIPEIERISEPKIIHNFLFIF